jgi:hypothetical protein
LEEPECFSISAQSLSQERKRTIMKQNTEKSKQEVSQEGLAQSIEELGEEALENVAGGGFGRFGSLGRARGESPFGGGGSFGETVKQGIGFSAGGAIFQEGMNILTGGGQPQAAQPAQAAQPTQPTH